jgi:hypothetical protein
MGRVDRGRRSYSRRPGLEGEYRFVIAGVRRGSVDDRLRLDLGYLDLGRWIQIGRCLARTSSRGSRT